MVSNVSLDEKTVLAFESVSLAFGGLMALREVSFDIREGEILAIIGPNGAGKTCVLNCINGYYKPQTGAIYFGGHKITKLSPHKIAAMGIARTFQNITLYLGMSVIDNIMSGRHIFSKAGPLACSFYLGKALKEEIRQREVVEYIIDFLELGKWRKKAVGSLPYGLQKKVDFGRTLALEPELLLLDEPMAGMSVEEKRNVARFIHDIFKGQGEIYSGNKTLSQGVKSIVMIEHDMGAVMDIAHRVIVLDFGRKIAEGTPDEIRSDKSVINAYLGVEA
jgi:branched-chain amino acid transport system ATP-binding protein